MQHSRETRCEERVTLPPIRDIFRDELSRSLHDCPIAVEKQRASPNLKPASLDRYSFPKIPSHRLQYSQRKGLDVMHRPDDPVPLVHDFWHDADARSRRESVDELDDELSDTQSCPSQCHSEAPARFLRRASDGMQFLYPPTHSQHSAYRFYDVCLPGQEIHSSLESDEKEHGSRAQRPQSRPSSSEGSNGGKVATAKYSCPYCGKGFNRPSSLKIHINSHTGEKLDEGFDELGYLPVFGKPNAQGAQQGANASLKTRRIASKYVIPQRAAATMLQLETASLNIT
ncbi:hypothetical protein JOM56_001976 [Amanita muscaria]